MTAATATHCALPQHQTRSLFLNEENCDRSENITHQKYFMILYDTLLHHLSHIKGIPFIHVESLRFKHLHLYQRNTPYLYTRIYQITIVSHSMTNSQLIAVHCLLAISSVISTVRSGWLLTHFFQSSEHWITLFMFSIKNFIEFFFSFSA